ncbi:MAG: CHRD domain-containing protein [Oscillatoriales cyanobacterium C42_A2020_001]|nr:CHRD domain-containing protein [Leptolyngbyaceae cyanobacterium C42_A2020_001]
MEGFDTQNHSNHTTGAADPSLNTTNSATSSTASKGASVQEAELEQSLNQALASDERETVQSVPDDHNHAPVTANSFELHISLDKVASAKTLDATKVGRETSFRDNLGSKGDYLNPRGGTNVVIGSGDSDVIRGTGRGFNTITTGGGRDSIILGKETTNRVFDFDPASDRFVLSGINPKNIVIAQGQNPGKGALSQPLDSVNNALVIDKKTGHILAALPFVKASDLNERHFVSNTKEANQSLNNLKELGFKNKRGDGNLAGTQGHDRIIGGTGNDFLYVGDDSIRFNTAKGGGGTEFPFATDSPGTSELNAQLKNGVLTVNGSYKDFDGFPLFSQGEKAIDPNAKILNGANPQALVDGFLKVPKDVEGNLISGTHLHFSPAGDSRGNFADATVIRYFENTPTDAKSGTIRGQFELTPEEQAALLGGTMYVNIHSNIDGDKDGRAGFPTGENRLNFNRDVVKIA